MKKIINILLLLWNNGFTHSKLVEFIFNLYKEIAISKPLNAVISLRKVAESLYGRFCWKAVDKLHPHPKLSSLIIDLVDSTKWKQWEELLLDKLIYLNYSNPRSALCFSFMEKLHMFFGVIPNSVMFKITLSLYIRFSKTLQCNYGLQNTTFSEDVVKDAISNMYTTVQLYLIQAKLFDDRSHVLMHVDWQIQCCAKELTKYTIDPSFVKSLIRENLRIYLKDDE